MRAIYVDDEHPAIQNFKYSAAKIEEITQLETFTDGKEAIEYVKTHPVDVAFLDMEMPGIHGLALALRLREILEDIIIIFVTAYNQYAFDAWSINATGYILKPYSVRDIRYELDKCKNSPFHKHKITIRTMPELVLQCDNQTVSVFPQKAEELLALLIDSAEHGLTLQDGIAALWPGKRIDDKRRIAFIELYRSLVKQLERYDIDYLLATTNQRFYLRMEEVDCDLYRILYGDEEALGQYQGKYLEPYPWAQKRKKELGELGRLIHHMNGRKIF